MYLKYKVGAFRNNGNLIKKKNKNRKQKTKTNIYKHQLLMNGKKQIFMLQF